MLYSVWNCNPRYHGHVAGAVREGEWKLIINEGNETWWPVPTTNEPDTRFVGRSESSAIWKAGQPWDPVAVQARRRALVSQWVAVEFVHSGIAAGVKRTV
jgi:hypothetical protein